MDEDFKKYLRNLFTKPKAEPILPIVPQEPLVLSRKANPDELALGFAVGVEDDTFREVRQLKGISQEHRDAHFYVIGATRVGKTKFLESLIKQDIENGLGFGVIDPHGDFTEDLKGYLYVNKLDDQNFLRENVVLIEPTNKTHTVAFNPLEMTDGESSARVASELTDAFKKIWADAWGARMENLLKNTLIALIENNLTLAEVRPFLTHPEIRRKILGQTKNDVCLEYFGQFNSLPRNKQNEWMESTLNKVDAFVFDPDIRQMLASPKSSFNVREVMDSGKILLVKLEKGRLKGNADLLGSLLLAKIQAAAFSRTDMAESKRRKFYLYIDEFQNFATESFPTVLAEAGKYKLPLILAHQQLAQLPPSLRAAILSNCSIQAYFRISRDDSNILAKESLTSIYRDPPGWEQYIQALQELKPRQCVIKNKIQGGVAPVWTLDLEPPHTLVGMDEDNFTEEVAAAGIGSKYLLPREGLEKAYKERREELLKPEKEGSFREPKRRLG